MKTIPALLIFGASMAFLHSGFSADKPNIVYIISDDHAWSDYGFMEHPRLETPHLDRLADEGTLFERGYVPTALCRPALASFATGLYAHQHKISGNDPSHALADPKESPARYLELQEAVIANIDDHPTLPELLGEVGYLSHQSGKWWEGNYRRGGFTHGMSRGFPEPGGRHGDDGLKIGREGMGPVFEFIDEAVEAGKPFFIWYAPFLPHTPHNPPKRLLDKYRDRGDPVSVARYYAMIEWLDETSGDLMDYIDEKGLTRETIFVYLGDNGWIPNPKRTEGFLVGSKQSAREAGVRQPTIFKWEGVIEPVRRTNDLISSIDVMPTLLAAAGARIPDHLPGINLLPILKSGQRSARETVYGEGFAHDIASIENPEASLLYRWIIDGRWKFILSYDGELGRYSHAHPEERSGPQLYDLLADPHETKNLFGQHPALAEHLGEKIRDWYPLQERRVILGEQGL